MASHYHVRIYCETCGEYKYTAQDVIDDTWKPEACAEHITRDFTVGDCGCIPILDGCSLELFDDDSSACVSLRAPAEVEADVVFHLPGVDVAGVLVSDGEGNWSFKSAIQVDGENVVIAGTLACGAITSTGNLDVTGTGHITSNVGIGVAPSTYRLWVVGANDVNYPLYTKVTRTGASEVVNALFFTDGNSTDCIGIRIRFGEDTPSGTGYCLQAQDGNGSHIGGLRYVGSAFADYDISDARIKQNIRDTSLIGRDTIMGIKVRDYEMIRNPGKKVRASLVSTEVLETFPEAVGDPDPETGLYAISRNLLVPPMIKHIQEIQIQADAGDILIELATSEREAMQDRIKELEDKIAVLEDK